MKVVFTCGREPEYSRNAMLRAALERHFDVTSIVDHTRSRSLRYIHLFRSLLRLRSMEHDLVVVGFLGQPLIPFIRRVTRKPILFDAFLSVYDTLCFDRRQASPRSLPGRASFWLDRTSCHLSQCVMLDTQAHAAYFHQTFDVPFSKLASVFVGCDERIFYPRPQPSDCRSVDVLYYGSFLPLQGIDVIVRAAKLLCAESQIHFRIIGAGMELASVKSLAHRLELNNVQFYPPVPLQQLPVEMAKAAICLGGHFGSSEKAGRVIAGKTFQCLAMGKPTIVGDNTANRELLTPGHDALFCRMADPAALASAILNLAQHKDLQEQLGVNARHTFLEHASIDAISDKVRSLIERLLGS